MGEADAVSEDGRGLAEGQEGDPRCPHSSTLQISTHLAEMRIPVCSRCPGKATLGISKDGERQLGCPLSPGAGGWMSPHLAGRAAKPRREVVGRVVVATSETQFSEQRNNSSSPG